MTGTMSYAHHAENWAVTQVKTTPAGVRVTLNCKGKRRVRTLKAGQVHVVAHNSDMTHWTLCRDVWYGQLFGGAQAIQITESWEIARTTCGMLHKLIAQLEALQELRVPSPLRIQTPKAA